MSSNSHKAVSTALRKLQNPYAKLSVFDENDWKREAFVKAGNPCAAEYVDLSQKHEKKADAVSKNESTLTQAAFDRGCREVFKSYSPAFRAGGRLGSDRKKFIDWGKRKSPTIRAQALAELQKYSLDDQGSFEPLLNRELGNVLDEKLAQIIKRFDH